MFYCGSDTGRPYGMLLSEVSSLFGSLFVEFPADACFPEVTSDGTGPATGPASVVLASRLTG